jgi:hypothetical protein
MTWVIGMPALEYAVMVSDRAMSRDLGRGYEAYETFRVKKSYAFGPGAVVGIAGDPRRGFDMLDSMFVDMEQGGKNGHDVFQNALAWTRDLEARKHKLAKPEDPGTEVMLIRTWHDPIQDVAELLVSTLVVIQAPCTDTGGAFRVTTPDPLAPWAIGSGSGIREYRQAVGRVASLDRLTQFTNFQLANPQLEGAIGQILAEELAQAVAEHPEPSVSVDLDVTVLGRGQVSGGRVQENPDLPSLSHRDGLEEAFRLAELEDKGRGRPTGYFL